MDPRELRRSAQDLLAAGRYAKAEVLFRQLLLQTPRDGHLWVKHAEALRRLARDPDAVDSYRHAAHMLADDGHLPRAIAALKLALELRPDDVDLISELIQLEVKKSRSGGRRAGLAAVLHDDAPFGFASRTATLQFAMPTPQATPARQLALPAAPMALDLDGTLKPEDALDIVQGVEEPARTTTQQFGAVSVEWLPPEPARPPEGPVVRRLSSRALAVQVSHGAQWLLVSSDAPLEVRYVDTAELPGSARD